MMVTKTTKSNFTLTCCEFVFDEPQQWHWISEYFLTMSRKLNIFFVVSAICICIKVLFKFFSYLLGLYVMYCNNNYKITTYLY